MPSDSRGAARRGQVRSGHRPHLGYAGRPATDFRLRLKVTDAQGRTDTRLCVVQSATAPVRRRLAIQAVPPEGPRATAQDGCVSVTWKPSPRRAW